MEFWKGFLEILTFCWPGRRVEQWERGGRYWRGRWVREVGPGTYWVLPWFGDVLTVSTAESIISTGRMDLTLRDETVLSVDCTASLRVVDPYRALNDVDGYQETAREALMASVASQLAREEKTAFEPRSRPALLKRIQSAVQEKLQEYGLEVGAVSFVSLVSNVKTHRLLIDQSSAMQF